MARASAPLLPVLAFALWPAQGQAQDGPSFDCDDAGTATEFAICASPDLSRLEMRMFESYQGLVDRIGERRARRLADLLLERRQACGADEGCIAQQLLVSMQAFDEEGLPETELAATEPPPAPTPDLPLAAQAPWPPESVPIPPVRSPAAPSLASAEPPSPEEMEQAIAGAELASSDDAPAPFDTPMSWAFMDLPREERAAIQARLQAAGYHSGPTEGTWDRATMEALDAYLAAEGADFDPTTAGGAALALDFIGSEAFAQAHGIAAPAAEVVEAPPVDPLADSEW